MTPDTNRFGLSRNIPGDVKRNVRKRCGFGCVVCGSAIYDYEHVSPEFKDARFHDPNCIALLCPTDHLKKKRGLLSDDDYLRHIKAPAALDKGFSFTDWSAGSFAPEILLGSFTFTGGTSILEVGNKLLLGFTPPEEECSPPGLILRYFDRRGIESFSIFNNEIQCQNEAFDIEAIGATWTVRSELRKIDLVLRFDPPTRITVERFHFRYSHWKLIAELGSLELRFDERPITAFHGGAKIHGPCLYKLAMDEPRVLISDMVITFGAGPSPIGAQPLIDGFRISWPVYCPVNPINNMLHISDVLNVQKILGLYTRKSFADADCPKGFRIYKLSEVQVSRFVEDYGNRDLIDFVAFNPDKRITTVVPWLKFLKTVERQHTNVLQPIEKDDPIAQVHDERPIAFLFPVYMFVRAEAQTPIQEIDVAVIHSADDLLPVFTEISRAEGAMEVLVGEYRIQKFGKNSFINFLRKVILPRKIELVVMNPDLTSSEKRSIKTIRVEDMVTDLSAQSDSLTDEDIDKLISDGKIKRI